MAKSGSSKPLTPPATFSVINTTLEDREIKYLYELLFYLSDLQKNGKVSGFDIRNKELKKFLKENGIIDELKSKGIQEGDTVRMIYFEFEYFFL